MPSSSEFVQWNESPMARYLAFGHGYWRYLLRALATWVCGWTAFFVCLLVLFPIMAGNRHWRDHVAGALIFAESVGIALRIVNELFWRPVRVYSDRISVRNNSWTDFRLSQMTNLRFVPLTHGIVRIEFETKGTWGRNSKQILGAPADKAAAASALLDAVKESESGQEAGSPREENRLLGLVPLGYRPRSTSFAQRVAFGVGISMIFGAAFILAGAVLVDLVSGVPGSFRVIAAPVLGALLLGVAGILCLRSGFPWLREEHRDRSENSDPDHTDERGTRTGQSPL